MEPQQAQGWVLLQLAQPGDVCLIPTYSTLALEKKSCNHLQISLKSFNTAVDDDEMDLDC
jgi:hypothetical protein